MSNDKTRADWLQEILDQNSEIAFWTKELKGLYESAAHVNTALNRERERLELLRTRFQAWEAERS